jgi:hypothetical protein
METKCKTNGVAKIEPEDGNSKLQCFINFTVLNCAEERYLKTLIIILYRTFFPELKLIACIFDKIVISESLKVYNVEEWISGRVVWKPCLKLKLSNFPIVFSTVIPLVTM